MVMDIGLFGTLRKLKLSSSSLRMDDDFIDRLNHYYTSVIIIVFTIIVSAKQYVGQPLQCWVPATFTKAMEQYAENYCWVQNTYWLPMEKEIPKLLETRNNGKIGYYQWVPFVLVCEAFMFYIPCVFWRLLNWQSGISVQGIVRMACDAQNVNPDHRVKTIRILSRHIQDSLNLQRDAHHRGCIRKLRQCSNCGKRFGNYLTLLYVITKTMYIANVIGQFFILNQFLSTRYTFYGFDILRDIMAGRQWEDSGRFPRVTMCDFEIRNLGNNHRHSVQCVLMINLFNEKIFIFLWFWYCFVATTTILSLIVWIFRMIFSCNRHDFVVKYLKIKRSIFKEEKKSCENFVSNYLRCDGVFVLRIIALNAGDVIATDVVNQIWQDYKTQHNLPLLMVDAKNMNISQTMRVGTNGARRQNYVENGSSSLMMLKNGRQQNVVEHSADVV